MKLAVAIAIVGVCATRAGADPAPPTSPAPDPASPPDSSATPGVPTPVPRPNAAPPGFAAAPTGPITLAPPSMTEPVRAPAIAPSRRTKPMLSAPRLLGEAGAGVALGFAGLALGAYTGANIECSRGCSGEFGGGLGGAMIGAYIGGSLGVSIGVYAVGVAGDNDGSYLATIGGALLGPLVGGLGAALIEKTSTGNDRAADTLAGMVFFGGWLGTTMALFNATRSAPAPAVLAFDRGHLSFGIPVVTHAERASYVTLVAGQF